jgi:hypothetical protein
LAAGEGGTHALEFGVGGGHVAAVGGDHRVHQPAGQIDRRARAAEAGYRFMTIQVFADAEP